MIYGMQVLTGKEGYVSYCVENWLLEDGEEAYSPTCERETKVQGEVVKVTARLFPGYIFIESDHVIDFYHRMQKVKSRRFLQALTRVLRAGEEFTPLKEEEEKAFLSLFGDKHNVGMSKGIIQDGKLHILEGPLTGREDDIIRIDRHKKTAILQMRILGKFITVKVGLEVTEKT